MKILHVAPHLGGGVGKAHAALRGALPKDVEQTFVLLEEPRDRRYVEAIEASSARVIISRDLDEVARLAGMADVVQFEFWNHPRLFECLARCRFAAMRSVFWSHISGLAKPVIQLGLMQGAGRFVFTTEASLSIPSMEMLSDSARRNIAVINSGFGCAQAPQRSQALEEKPTIAYLGTVDFAKMHPGFFDAVDRLGGDDIHVMVWGDVDPAGAVATRARSMRHCDRIRFCGRVAEPADAFSAADIFFYPLQADHYGTAENALIEAMSVGLTPVVINNPAERAIVSDGDTGFVARSIEECAWLLQMLLRSPGVRDRISRNAVRHVARTRTPARSAQDFMSLWRELLDDEPRRCNFQGIVGENPAEWLVATQCLPGEMWTPPPQTDWENAAKGTLTHFEHVFAGDASLSRLRLQMA